MAIWRRNDELWHALALLAALALILFATCTARAQLWAVGITNSGTAFGASDNYGVALTWDWVTQSDFHGFSGTSQYPFTVCTALSPNEEYAAVEQAHRDGILWLCEDGQCWDVGTGIIFTIDDHGDAAGATRWTNGVGLLLTNDGARRWEFPQFKRIMYRDRHFVYVRWQSGAESWLYRDPAALYDFDRDGRITNFDIGPFVDALLSGEPNDDDTFVIDGFDIDPFVAELLR